MISCPVCREPLGTPPLRSFNGTDVCSVKCCTFLMDRVIEEHKKTKQSDGTIYDADYYLHGKETGKSLYDNYHWMPELTIPMVCAMVSHLGIKNKDTILDFGCARGYTVRAFREMGYDAWGVDISEWAIDNCDPNVNLYVRQSPLWVGGTVDWVIAKDVLEHVSQVADIITELMNSARIGIFAVVPLAISDDGTYLVREYEKDVTHIHRLTLATWARMFVRPGWSVTMAYRVSGVKDNYSSYERGNGFLTVRRLEQ